MNHFIEGMKQLYELQAFLDVRFLRPEEELSRVREELFDWDLGFLYLPNKK